MTKELSNCECGAALMDAGPLGVNCSNINCPVGKTIVQQVASKKCVLEVYLKYDGFPQKWALRHVRDDGSTFELLESSRPIELRHTHEPPEEPPVFCGGDGKLPKVPSGVDLIEWCVRQIQITCDGLNLDPAQWLNDSTAQGDSAQPPKALCGCGTFCALGPTATSNDTQCRRIAEGLAQPPEPSRLTDTQCDEIVAALETYEWTGFTRDDIRLIAGTIDTYRSTPTKSGEQS